MYNYNRDVYQAENERSEKMMTSASRHVPLHLRIDNRERISNWLSSRVISPWSSALSGQVSLVKRESARYWRRASSRAAG
ncbi:MAG: hypothetical protein ACK2T3_02390, partial [Candidatus Promineifilaceae bacterium]